MIGLCLFSEEVELVHALDTSRMLEDIVAVLFTSVAYEDVCQIAVATNHSSGEEKKNLLKATQDSQPHSPDTHAIGNSPNPTGILSSRFEGVEDMDGDKTSDIHDFRLSLDLSNELAQL